MSQNRCFRKFLPSTPFVKQEAPHDNGEDSGAKWL